MPARAVRMAQYWHEPRSKSMLPLVDGEEYTAQEAARILRTTERTIRRLRRRLERGDLDGRQDPTTGRWFVSARSVTAAMPDRPPKESQALPDASSEVAELRARVEDLLRQLGRLEGRLELSERTESTLREHCGKGSHMLCPLGVYLA